VLFEIAYAATQIGNPRDKAHLFKQRRVCARPWKHVTAGLSDFALYCLGEPFVPPVSDASGQDRALLRKASALLREAGCPIKEGKRMTQQGAPFTVEFLLDDPVSTRHHISFIKNLGILGIDANLRIVDPVQYRKRVDDFDFDIVVQRFGFSNTPGDSLRTFFTSHAASMRGSQNIGGIADPVIDALVDRVISADSRAALVSAGKALDRVIRSGRYWVPHWYKASHWLAYWDVFGRPQAQPRYALAIPGTWWSALS
jgi:microcin C transport system substrate-binding protein